MTAGPGPNHLWSCKWPADYPSWSPGCRDLSYTLWWGFWGLWGWPSAWLTLPLWWPGGECLRHQACTLQGHPQQGIHIDIDPSCPIIQLKVVIGQAGHPLMAQSIQLGCCQDIGQGIVVCIDIKGPSVTVFVKFLDHGPFEGKKLQFMGRVMRFSLCQAPTGVGNDHYHESGRGQPPSQTYKHQYGV